MAQQVGVRSIPDLKQFGRDLATLSDNLSQAYHMANRKMQAVCEGWNDQKSDQFMEEFRRNELEIDKIAQHMKDFSSFINKSCAILEQYQSIRM